MKIIMLGLIPLVLAGCVSTLPPAPTPPASPDTANTSSTPENQQATKILLDGGDDPNHIAQATAVVYGAFFWDEGCIYLIEPNRKYAAAFPKWPAGGVLWNEQDKILTLKDANDFTIVSEFKMGDTIRTNGHYIGYNPDVVFDGEEDTKKCLRSGKDGVAFVGTMGIRHLTKEHEASMAAIAAETTSDPNTTK